MLKRGAIFAFTDFISRPSITPHDLTLLRELWAFPSLFTVPRYVAALDALGVEVLLAEDHTGAVVEGRTRGLPDDELWWHDFVARWGEAEAKERFVAGRAWQSVLEQGRAGYGMFIARRMPADAG